MENRKREFVRRVADLTRGMPQAAAELANNMARQVNAESLPDDVEAAAVRFAKLCERAAAGDVPAA
jgi:hypothetical protein